MRELDRRVTSSTPSVRRALLRAVRRVFGALSGAPPSRALVPARPVVVAPPAPEPPPEDDTARLRARAALAEARAQMPSLLEERPSASAGDGEHIPAESAVLRQALRSYTDHVERLLSAADDERRALREQVNRLSEDMLIMRAEVDTLRAALPVAAGMQRPALEGPAEQHADREPSGAEPPPNATDESPSEQRSPSGPGDAEAQGEAVAAIADVGAEVPSEIPPVPEPPPSVPLAAPLEEHTMRMPVAATLERAPQQVIGRRGPHRPVTDLRAAAAPAPDAVPPDEGAASTGDGPRSTAAGEQPVASDTRGSEVEERLAARIFPAGTVGVTVAVWPVASFEKLRSIQEGLSADPLVERTELLTYEEGEATIRLNFRRAARWPWLRATVERVAAAQIRSGSVTYERGTISLMLTDPHESSGA